MPIQGVTYTFEDLSGSSASSAHTNPNPYVALIEACDDDATEIQARYHIHRATRTSQQRSHLCSSDFPGVNLDAILIGLLREEFKNKTRPRISSTTANSVDEDGALLRGLPRGVIENVTGQVVGVEEDREEFVDHRHNLSFWARPPERIRALVGECQKILRSIIPDIWLMPLSSLHMTTLELTHSRTPSEISSLIAKAAPLVPTLSNLPHSLAHNLSTPLGVHPTSVKRARLVKPALTYDAAALAITLLPADESAEDSYTYHHLRRDLWEILSETSTLNSTNPRDGTVPVASRYVVPSAHLTIARFVTRWDVVGDIGSGNVGVDVGGMVDAEKMSSFATAVDGINAWLEKDYWGKSSVDWVVGEEKGLEFHAGASWFGGGVAVENGKDI